MAEPIPRIFVDYNNQRRSTGGDRCYVATPSSDSEPMDLHPGDRFIADNAGDGVPDHEVVIHERRELHSGAVIYLFRDADMFGVGS